MNTNDAGRYGVLRLLKKNEVDTVVASYPIDEEEVTFGRDPDCSVRLYYPTVSGIHAKIIFQERKAFLVVLGAHGLLIDNCPAFPAPSSDYPTTIPVSNNSEIEIHKKRFKFEYPPKALRTILLATPSPSKGKAGRRRTLRMSMIQSAHVFSPGPDPDPRVNLRVLQTPIRPLGSPLKARMQQEADGDEDEEASIVLVDGNHPRVVEEDKDLVILEDVEVQEPTPQVQPLNIKKHASMGSATPGRSRLASGSYAAPVPSLPVNRPQQQFQTPRRKPPRSSLHRAVLIRSAQRAVMRVEVEEEKEEQEVEETVNAADVAIVEEQSGFEEQEEEDAMDEDQQEEYEEELGDEDGDTREEDREVGPISSLRKSLEAVKNTWQAFRSRSRSPEKADRQEQDIADEQEYDEEAPKEPSEGGDDEFVADENVQTIPVDAELEDDEDSDEPAYDPRHFTPQRPQRPPHAVSMVQPFMTPQAQRGGSSGSLADRVRGLGRYSVGGTGPRGRVPANTPWMVKDIVLPNDPPSHAQGSQNVPNSEKKTISEREKMAIQERRRSAFAMPDLFFGEHIPGSRRPSLAPAPPSTPAAAPTSFNDFISPSKAWAAHRDEKDDDEDASILLERMKQMVDGMKRRRSIHAEDEVRRAILSETVEEEQEGDEEVFAEDVIDEEDEGMEAGEAEGVREDQDMDVDEEEAHDSGRDEPHVGPSTPAPAPEAVARLLPKTPHMSDLKHLFSSADTGVTSPRYTGVRELFHEAARNEQATPRLDGVREMYHRERAQVPGTPAYDGVAELLAEPADEDLSQETQSDGRVTPDEPTRTPAVGTKPRSNSNSSAASTTRARKTPARGRATPTDGSAMADDEETPGLPPARPGKKGTNIPKAAVVRRTRRAESEMEEESPVVVAKPSSRTKTGESTATARSSTRTKAAAPTPVQETSEPARRTRKATKSAPSTDDEPPVTKPVRNPSRATKAAAIKVESDSETPEAEPAKPVRRGAARAKASKTPAVDSAPAKRRAVKAKAVEVDTTSNDDDPLDSIEQPESPEEVPAAAKVRRGRSKAAATPDDDEDDGTENSALRSSRGRKTPTTATTGATRAAATKSRTAASSSKIVEGKENTPERKTVKEEEEEVKAKPAAAKVSRVRKAAAAKAQSEPEKDVAGPAPKTRAARTRAASARK